MLKLLFCLTQLNRGTEPKNEREHAAVSISFLQSNGGGIGTDPDRLDADKLYLSHPGFLTAPEEQEQSWCPALTSLGVEIWWESPDALSGFGLCVKLLFQEGQGQTVKCSFRAISAHMHSPAILPSVFFREHVSIWQTLLFFLQSGQLIWKMWTPIILRRR